MNRKITCEVISNLDFLDTKENWTGINTIVKIISERTIKKKKTGIYSCETRFYITSLNLDAKQINSSIRGNWALENNLHWTLDVIMKEEGQLNYTKHIYKIVQDAK